MASSLPVPCRAEEKVPSPDNCGQVDHHLRVQLPDLVKNSGSFYGCPHSTFFILLLYMHILFICKPNNIVYFIFKLFFFKKRKVHIARNYSICSRTYNFTLHQYFLSAISDAPLSIHFVTFCHSLQHNILSLTFFVI